MDKVLHRRSRRSSSLSTIKDVAALAGVSTATVSRYLNNPDIVAATSRERVREAIADLNFVPNALAGSLAAKHRDAVAIFVPYLVESMVLETVEQLVERMISAGTMPFVGVTGMDPHRTNEAMLAALGRRVSALITTGIVEEPLASMLRQTNTTVIQMWGLNPDPVDIAIGFSHLDVGRALGRFAHENGYRRPHLVTAQGTRAARRREGFLEVWHGLGLPPPTEDEVPIPTHYHHAAAVLAHVLTLDPRPDLVVTGSDTLAHGLIIEAGRAGLRVPQDLAVTGFGDMKYAAHVEPPITTVRLNAEVIADTILKVIADRREGIEPQERCIDCGFSLVRRQSA